MVAATFCTALKHLSLPDTLPKNGRVGDWLYLTKQFSDIEERFPYTVIRLIGTVEYNHLANASGIVYGKTNFHPSEDPYKVLDKFLGELEIFLQCTWMIKDNSANFDTGFLIYEIGDKTYVSSNIMSTMFFQCTGDRHVASFSFNELKEAVRIFENTEAVPRVPGTTRTQLTSSVERINRANYFIQSARDTSDLGNKIADYCSAFEALLATNPQELSHQLSERVAALLGGSPNEKWAIYREIKQAYQVRSKIVHGSGIKTGKLDELLEISKTCDQRIRECVNLYFSSPRVRRAIDADAATLDEFLVKKVFGKND